MRLVRLWKIAFTNNSMLIYIGKEYLAEFAGQSKECAAWHIHYQLDEVDCFVDGKNYLFFIDAITPAAKKNYLQKELEMIEDIDAGKISQVCDGNYFVVAITKKDGLVSMFRDPVGVKSGYYFIQNNSLRIGTNMHQVAVSAGVKEFDQSAVYQLLYSGYLMNGFTFYRNVHEVKMGEEIHLDQALEITSMVTGLKLAEEENVLTEEKNISALRKEIQEAHRKFLSDKNLVLLSGGLDSVAMLGALDDVTSKEKIKCVSFKVKDTIQDETLYADAAASFLDISNTIIEVDPFDESIYSNFEEKLLQMNNPYDGVWIFGNFTGDLESVYYAGQDTRLHTPALSILDKMAFSVLKYQYKFLYNATIKPFFKGWRALFELFGFDISPQRNLRGLYRFSSTFDTLFYARRYYLKFHERKLKKLGIDTSFYKDYMALHHFPAKIKSKRHLYNVIVEQRWKEQYISDIRYMQDMARMNKTYIAMPFYNLRLARFSSAIPFKLATRMIAGKKEHGNERTIINKYVLRKAFRDKMPDVIYYRDKGGSQTIHQLFNGVLGEKVRSVFNEDLASVKSFIQQYRLEAFAKKFLETKEWPVGSEDFLQFAHYISAMCIYQKRVLKVN